MNNYIILIQFLVAHITKNLFVKQNNIKMDLKQLTLDWIHLAQWETLVITIMRLVSITCRNFLISWKTISFLKRLCSTELVSLYGQHTSQRYYIKLVGSCTERHWRSWKKLQVTWVIHQCRGHCEYSICCAVWSWHTNMMTPTNCWKISKPAYVWQT